MDGFGCFIAEAGPAGSKKVCVAALVVNKILWLPA